MPYRRRGYKKRRFKRKSAIKKLSRRIARCCPRPELKYHTILSGFVPIKNMANAPWLRLTTITRGESGSQRNGSMVQLKGATLRMQFRNSIVGAGNPHGDIIRLVIIKQIAQVAGGADPLDSTVFESPGTNPLAMRQIGTTRMFRTLVDKQFRVPPVASATFPGYTRHTLRVPYSGPVRYTQGDTGGTDVLKGEIWYKIFGLHADGGSGANQSQWQYFFRGRYTDS